MPSSHRYGPHRPEDAPNAVTVLGAGKWPRPEVVPLPPALVRQREQMNTMAAESARWGLHPCEGCGLELDADDRHDLCEDCEPDE